MRIINKSLIRYELTLGGESELIGVLAVFCGAIVFANMNLINGIIAGGLWFIGLFFLRRLAKIDPIFFKVYQNYLAYQKYYPAKTPKWRIGSGYSAK